MIHRFADFELDAGCLTLRYRGARVDLPPKTVRTLVVLFERAGTVVSKADLMDAVWPDGFVEEGNLTQHMYLLRRLFASRGIEGAIETYPRRGYALRLPPLHQPRSRAGAGLRNALACLLFLGVIVATAPLPRTNQAVSQVAYGLGSYYLNLRSVDGMKRSISYFERVVADAPERAAGYAGLADAYTMLYDFERPCAQCNAWREAAVRNARIAVSVEPASARAHVSAGMVARIFHDDDTTAEREFRFALSIDPDDALAHEWYGNLLVARGALDEARRELEIAAAEQPVATATYAWLARANYYERRYVQAEQYARQALELQPSRVETRVVLGLVDEARGRYADALRQFDDVARLGAVTDARVLRASVIAAMGHRDIAIAMLRQIASRATRDPYASRDMVLAYATADDERDARVSLAHAQFSTRLDRRLFSQDPHVRALQPEPAPGRSN
ncbi:MAG: winged helix-turn-helix domain-containing protein [Candidatus Eremiobacteraeota bacterium]|nr:winged helix-turn-helix domain-containing protein [Candidatus Eremiobacteraeota bacterium]